MEIITSTVFYHKSNFNMNCVKKFIADISKLVINNDETYATNKILYQVMKLKHYILIRN